MRFRSDSRSQAIQIGAVLIFGLLIVVLASYQAFVVPSQNAEVEFNHHQDVERDMVDLRANILQAKTTGEDRFTTVKLGTEYSSRIIARNPPDPGGTLRTTENKTIAVETGDGDDMSDLFNRFAPENKFIEFAPNYANLQDAGTIRYENTVVYKDFDDTNLVMTNQRLIREDTVSLIPIHRDFQASGRQAASIEPVPGVLEREDVEDIEVTLGTALSEEDWVEDILADEIERNDKLDAGDISVDEEAGELTLDLEGNFTLEYAPVGMDRSPLGGVRGDERLEINPAAPGDIQLVAADWGDETVELTFRNNADEGENNSFASGRVPFFDVHPSGDTEVNDVVVDGVSRAENTPWPVPSSFRNLDPNIELEPGEDNMTTIEIEFEHGPQEQQEWFVIEFRLETGETATYFIGGSFG